MAWKNTGNSRASTWGRKLTPTKRKPTLEMSATRGSGVKTWTICTGKNSNTRAPRNIIPRPNRADTFMVLLHRSSLRAA